LQKDILLVNGFLEEGVDVKLFLDFNLEFDFKFLIFIFEEEDGRRDFMVLAADSRVGWAAV
jgi:hypothetical protein